MAPREQRKILGTAAGAARDLAAEMELLRRAEHPDPFAILGPHRMERNQQRILAIRTFQPRAGSVSVIWEAGARTFPARRIHPDGIFESVIPWQELPASTMSAVSPRSYRLQMRYDGDLAEETYDAYAFPPVLSDFDLYLMGEGTHYQNYEKLGAHVREIAEVRGVHFAVWAPNAKRVSVVGDFNRWDGRVHAMRSRGTSGVWEIFLPGLTEGLIYKFEVKSAVTEYLALKADPYAFQCELRPNTGSVIRSIDGYSWGDREWMEARAKRDWFTSPVSIYEAHFGSWRRKLTEGNRWLTYRELADELVRYVKQMGYTHIELLPVMEHPYDGSWGYQTLGYFAVTARFGAPADYMYFVDRCHQEGIGVLMDWTPAHFPRDAHGLAYFDGTHLYEHADPRRGAHPDWGTLVFNYGRTEVQNFLISNALFWLDRYHIDGLRVDAVASMLYLDYSRKEGEWLPNESGGRENLEAIAFLKRLNEVVHARHAGIMMIAEESTAWPAVTRPTNVSGLGFDFKWNMGWMNDTLRYIALDPIHRKYHHNDLTFSMIYAFSENFILPLSHDEVVHGKRSLLSKIPGDDWQQFANLRLLLCYLYAHPGKKLLFMGGELGTRNEWWEESGVEWGLAQFTSHRGMQRLVADLNRVYASERALYEVDYDWPGFEWLDADDAAASVLSFVRHAKDGMDALIVVCNFTPVVRENYRIGVAWPGAYREILNSDSSYYWGSDQGNGGGIVAEATPWKGRPYSLKLRLPPLAAIYLKPKRD